MYGLNHLREQSANTLIDKILEEVYTGLIVQVQPKLLLKLLKEHQHKSQSYKNTKMYEHGLQMKMRIP